MISQKRWDRLIGHLEELEKQTGSKLREKPRVSMGACPMYNFAPDRSGKADFSSTGFSGTVYYGITNEVESREFHIHSPNDRNWWVKLPHEEREEITKKLMQWLKER